MFGCMGDTCTVQRSATIGAAPDRVFAHIVDFHNWGAWSPWDEMDPEMEKKFSGPDSGPGAKYSWSGNRKVGQGRMEIKDATEPSSVHIALEFIKPFKARNRTEFSLEPTSDGTNVTWAMTGKKTFMTRILGIFKSMDSMVGPDFEKGLATLKAVVESEAALVGGPADQNRSAALRMLRNLATATSGESMPSPQSGASTSRLAGSTRRTVSTRVAISSSGSMRKLAI